MMERGELIASEVLPKVAKEFRRAAREGGAYELALKGLRVTEGQLATQTQIAAKTIFNSGFEEGLSELYKTLSNILQNSDKELKKLGDVFGKVFKGIAYMFKVLEPLMKAFINNMELIAGAWALNGIYKLSQGFKMLGMSIRAAFLPMAAGLAVAEELISLFSDDIVGVLESQAGMQINLKDQTTSELYKKDGKLFTKSPEDMMSGWKDTLNFIDKANQWSPTNLFNPFNDKSPLRRMIIDKPQAQAAPTVIQHNTIEANDANTAIEVYHRLTNEALGR